MSPFVLNSSAIKRKNLNYLRSKKETAMEFVMLKAIIYNIRFIIAVLKIYLLPANIKGLNFHRSRKKCLLSYSFFKDVEAGEINIIVSPLKKVRPIFLLISLFIISFVLSTTKLIWISKANNVPTNCLSPFKCTKTSLFLELFSKSKGLSIPLTIVKFA